MTRKPTQARSKATVDSIVNAGFIALMKHGWNDVTTRHIADIAGVGVGSLYEYFQNKDQIFGAMTERLVSELVGRIKRAERELVGMSVGETVRSLTRILRELLEEGDGRYLYASRHALHLNLRDHLRPLERTLFDLSMRYLAEHPELMRIRDLRVMSYIFIHGGISAVVHHLSDPHPPITFDALVGGLVRMIAHFIDAELGGGSADGPRAA